MNHTRFAELTEDVLKEIKDVLVDKNLEYARTGREGDALANFKRRAAVLEIDPISILAVDMWKHTDAINNFIIRNRQGSHVQLNDPIRRRIIDNINYLILFLGLIEDAAINNELTRTGRREHDNDITDYVKDS